MMFYDVIAPAESPQLSAHTYTGIYGGSSGCNISIDNKEIVIPAGKTIYTPISRISGGSGCYLLGTVMDNPQYNEEIVGYPYDITFRDDGRGSYRSVITTSAFGFDRYYSRFMTITPELPTTDENAPAIVNVYSYRTDLELVTAFNNGVASSNVVGSFESNTINFDFYYGAVRGREVIAQVGDILRVRIINASNEIIAETNFIETSTNTEEPTIVDAP
jgi:hypothetical protein